MVFRIRWGRLHAPETGISMLGFRPTGQGWLSTVDSKTVGMLGVSFDLVKGSRLRMVKNSQLLQYGEN